MLEDSPELCTPDEVARYWPGGEENPHGRTRAGWTYCYGQLCGLLKRGELTPTMQEKVQAVAEDAARDAQRQLPEFVELEARVNPSDKDSARVQVAVFPKSLHALWYIHDVDEIVRRALMTYHELREHTHELYAKHGGALLERVDYYHQLLCWIVCFEEPWLPFKDSETAPEPPAWVRALTPRDVLYILQAHKYVNGARAALAMRLLEGPSTLAAGAAERATSWKTLLASAGKEMGIPVTKLARDYTLESIVAQLAVARRSELDASPRQPLTDRNQQPEFV